MLIKEQAQQELEATILYYEGKRKNLGVEFLEETEFIFNLITDAPELFSLKYKNTREALLKRFPYIIVYEIEQNSIVVYSIFNTSRNPKSKIKK
ncbi:MAG: type II toxin-antitoxin system RelE/ParE family toxin [Bacteroidia bacterium]